MSRDAKGRPRFSFRPNLERPDHKKAWEILQAVPEGRKNAFLVDVILFREEHGDLESTLRRILKEELQKASLSPVQGASPKPEIPSPMLGFLQALADETEET